MRITNPENLPWVFEYDQPPTAYEMAKIRELERRYGKPESERYEYVPVIQDAA